MKTPVRIAITGAAGQIAYSLIFRIAAGDMFGPEQPVVLHLLEVPQALPALNGVLMELDDCAYPLLDQTLGTDDPAIAFQDVDYALLVGATPRGPGMERKDLLLKNAEIFKVQGQALNEYASRDVKILVVGNPANTNAYIAMHAAPNIAPTQFSAMTRLDHNRAIGQLALRTASAVNSVKKVCIWGNHSASQYPDISHATIGGVAAKDLVEWEWVENEFMPCVQQRGAEVIKARGKSSAASAANAAIMHMNEWICGTPADDWISMAIPSDGSYGIPEGLIYSFPVTAKDGVYQIVPGLEIDSFSRQHLDANVAELQGEKEAIASLLDF